MPRRPQKDVEREMFVTRDAYLQMRELVVKATRSFPSRIAVLDPVEHVCDAERCPAWAGTDALYADDNHLSPRGTERLIPLLQRSLDESSDRSRIP